MPHSTNPTVIQYDKRPFSQFNPVFPQLPPETDWFVINNHIGYHGSLLLPPKFKKITMFFAGKINEEKHLELLKRSIEKYKNYVVYN